MGGPKANGLWGNLGNDSLDGGAVNDLLFSGEGDDTLVGGAGKDVMTGGLGADTFVFTARTQCYKATSDLITDFTSGSDHIDLSQIDANTLLAGDQAFLFIAGAAFWHTAGKLRVLGSGAGSLNLAGDINGDAVTDFVLKFDLTRAGSRCERHDLVTGTIMTQGRRRRTLPIGICHASDPGLTRQPVIGARAGVTPDKPGRCPAGHPRQGHPLPVW